MANSKAAEDSPILHVVVVGFHHKKGCQVEYSYPPLIPGGTVDSHDVPDKWKHLPSLALPDGAHNYSKDTVFFHLPSRDGSCKTVYGVSCYRQMDAKDLINRTADVTRSTVQKCVCVLSRLPLFGLIKAKLELITHAYFDEKDFSKVELLQQTFNNLSQSMTDSLLEGTQIFLGLSAREVVMKFKHKVVVLFKLLMLERKVLFFGSPVENLSSTLLAVLSLFPNMLEFGLEEAVVREAREVSPTMEMASLGSDESEGFLEVRYSSGSRDAGISNVSVDMKNLPLKRSSSVEPQSLSIPRDGNVASAGDNIVSDAEKKRHHSQPGPVQSKSKSVTKALKNSENEQLKMTNDSKGTHSRLVRSFSHDDRAKVHSISKRRSNTLPRESEKGLEGAFQQMDDPPGSPKDLSEIVYSKEDSPLQHMPSITQVEAVQTGITMPNDEELMEEYAREVELASSPATSSMKVKELRPIALNEQDPLLPLKKTDSFEDLDSPESISRIDREDCFSWEDDRVLLAIDHELSRKDSSDDAKGANSDMEPDSNVGSSVRQESSIDEKSAMSSLSESNENSPRGSFSSGRSSRSGRHSSPAVKAAALKSKLSSAFGNLNAKGKGKMTLPIEMKPISREETLIQQDEYGFPLAIFTRGSVCHPYLSLQYHDILSDVNIKCFVIGATNVLFKQRRSLLDAIVEINEGRVEIQDRELQRLLHLTTADLRFADYLVKTVVEDQNNIYLDGTEWEGGDEWIRAQFRLYLQSLLATMLQEDPKLTDDFGHSFIQAWKTTQNFRFWSKADHAGLKDIPTGHPFQGHLNVADLRVRLSHNLQNSERGKKINAAVVQTSKYMVQTGRAVGGALSNARSALSSWFGGFSSEKSQASSESQGKSEEN